MEIISPDSISTTNSSTNNNKKDNTQPSNNNVPNNPFKCTNLFVYGLGKMGPLVAAELAINGYHVDVFDHLDSKMKSATSRIYAILQQAVETKLLENLASIDTVMARIHLMSSISEARDADIVFECCADNMPTKERVYREMDELFPRTTILASNTINIPMAQITPHAKRFPARVIGTRFLFPVLSIPRVEVTHSGDPFGFAVKKMILFLKSIQKKPYFLPATGTREVLTHDQVVEIYEEQAIVFKKLGYPGKVTIPRVYNTPPPSASSTTASPATTASPSTAASPSTTTTAASSSSTSTTTSTASHSSSSQPEKANDESTKCVVCMETDRNSVFVPCGHICTCFKCGEAVHKSGSPICPICRGVIQSVVMTYVV